MKVGVKLIAIKNRHLRITGYCLLVVSIIAFFLTWLEWYIGIPATLLLIWALYGVIKNVKEDQRAFYISKEMLILIFLIVVAWVLLSGIGGAFPQKSDIHWRNAIFHDLINYPWPVRYEDGFGSSLTYYIGFWLIPALFGKGIAFFFGAQAGWIGANVVTAVYCTAIVFVVLLLLLSYLNCSSKKNILIVMVLLILFSGMDILGVVVSQLGSGDFHLGTHLEWWNYIEYSANTSQLAWVYNQAIPAWLTMSLLLHEKKINHFAFLGLLLLPYGPLPFIGVFYLMVVEAIRRGLANIKSGKGKELVGQVFSIPNILGCMVILPIFYFYFSTNMAATGNAGSWNTFYVVPYILFVIFEFALILILIWKYSYKLPYFLPSAIGLFVIPWFKFGGGQDFCMRASIPLLFILMLYTIDYLIHHLKSSEMNIWGINKKVIPLLIILLIGAATPLDEYRESYLQIKESGSHCTSIFADKIKTLDNGDIARDNFITKHASDTFFYRYLAKGEKQ